MPSPNYFEDFEVGTIQEFGEYEVTEEEIIDFAEIANYLNKNNIKIEDISTDDGDLEDVFVQLTKH